MTKSDFAPVPPDTRVFRLVRHTESLFPPGEKKPLPAAFRPSNDDKQEAQRRKKPVMVSVWDTTYTTVDNARAIRDCAEKTTAFSMHVSKISEIQRPTAEGKPVEFLDTRYDDLTDSTMPGADGHAGIIGLDRPSGSPKQEFQNLMSKLVDLCERMDD